MTIPLRTRSIRVRVNTRKRSLAYGNPTDYESYGPMTKGHARLRQVSAFADLI